MTSLYPSNDGTGQCPQTPSLPRHNVEGKRLPSEASRRGPAAQSIRGLFQKILGVCCVTPGGLSIVHICDLFAAESLVRNATRAVTSF